MIRCQTCQVPILDGQLFENEEKGWHIDHFQCFCCKTNITSNYIEKDGEYYCVKCFGAKFSKICSYCSKPIFDSKFLRVMEDCYHLDHFKCNSCQKMLKDDKKYHTFEGKVLCTECFQSKTQKCFICKQPITDTLVEISGKQMHSSCLTCGRCSKIILNEVIVHENKYLHKECYKEIINPQCAVCKDIIEEDHLQVHDCRLHPFCYSKLKKISKAVVKCLELKKSSKNKEKPINKPVAAAKTTYTEEELSGLSEDIKEKLMNQLFYDYKTLVNSSPEGIDFRHKEMYLSPTEFEQIMIMTKLEFYKLKDWRQQLLKKSKNLF